MRMENGRNTSDMEMKKYLFYRELGYSAETAELLSALTYGGEALSSLLKELGTEDTLKRLRAWLAERPEKDPMQAVRNWYYGRQRQDPRETGVRYGSAAGFGGVMANCAPPAPAPAQVRKARLSMSPGSGIRNSVSRTVPRAKRACAPMANMETGMKFCVFEEPDSDAETCYKALDVCGCLEALATDSYEPIEEKGAREVLHAPTSTFRMTTNTASMGMVMNQLRAGRHVEMEQVRIEEILNYFDYRTEEPTEDKFRVSTELLDKGGNKKILCINARAKAEAKARQNIVLLLDTSGSMDGNNETTQEAIAAIVSKLRPGDCFSIVTYSDEDHVVLDGFSFRGEEDRDRLMAAVLGIVIDGCTYGSAGIERAYQIGAKHYSPDAANQVILITDGDLNFGVTEKGGLRKLIEEKKKSNLFLSVIGTGLRNYKDDKLETLAKHGNGTYCVVNNLFDVNESVNKRYVSLTNIVAKDVKAQVEFNPKYVRSYRLLGYENRELSHEDFANDEVISEPYGSGGHGVALYELEMEDGVPQSDLRYVRPVLNESNELCTVKLRYKEPLGGKSTELVFPVLMAQTEVRNAQLAYFLYCASEKLRGSDRLDAYDEEFLKVMLTSELYRNYAEENGEKLELIAKAYSRRSIQNLRSSAEPASRKR